MDDSGKKILLVEDNDLDVIIVQRLMRRLKLDYPIVRARNGEEALEILRPHGDGKTIIPPFTMIVDINMPRMNGFELLDEIIDDPVLSQVPIYIMSTSDRDKDKSRAKQYRIRGYVVKPVTQPVLLEILDSSEAA